MLKIELNDSLREKIEKTHWNWFFYRLRKKCDWDPSKNYFQYLKENVKLFDSTEIHTNTTILAKNLYARLKFLIIGNQENPSQTATGRKIDFSFFESLNGIIKKPRPRQRKTDGETDEAFARRKKTETQPYNNLEEIFGYDDFSKSSKKDQDWYEKNKIWYDKFLFRNNNEDWNIKVLCEKLQIEVCPYCNRQYIYTYENGTQKSNTAEIDHFRPKSKYPYLSCSLYNFVPSCHTCNSIKHDKDANIIYPYKEGFGNAGKFQIKRDDAHDIEFPVIIQNLKPKVTIKELEGDALQSRIQKSKEVLHLEEIYSKHQLDINDLLLRYNRYGKMKKKEIAKNLEMPESVIKKMILGFPLQIGKKRNYILEKFKKDVVEQLDKKNQ